MQGDGDSMSSQLGTGSFLHSTARLAKVVRVLMRHGFSSLLRGTDHWPPPGQVRAALEELGVVFLKLGQVLSTRRDLLPPEYVAELEKLQDQLAPEEDGVVEDVIEAELGEPPGALFKQFDPKPFAAATIAQVHAATLPDGREVVVKIQRPGLEERITEDLAVLAYLAASLDALVPALRPFDAPALVREFHTTLLHELDFRREANNVARFRRALADVPGLWIPDVIPDRSAARVITFELSHGVRVADYVERHPDQRTDLARRLAALFLRQVFEEGLFHADPHPGNFFVLGDGRLCLHDFGMIGELDPRTREALADLLACTVRGDARGATEAYFELGLVGADVDRRIVEEEIAILQREIRQRPLAEVSVGDALESLLRLGGQHRIRNPGTLLLLSRAFITLEAVMRDLDPELSVIDAFRDALPGMAARRFSPDRLAADASEIARDFDRLLREAPSEVRRVLHRLAAGDLGELYMKEHATVAQERNRALVLMLRAVTGGFLTVAGATLLAGEGWRLAVGSVLFVLGLGSLAVTALRAGLRR